MVAGGETADRADPARASDASNTVESTASAAFVRHAARVRFVLVEPSHPGNIGAAARALRTMGFARLAVVAPQVPQFHAHADAVALATHGADVLASASVHASLAEALHGVQLAFAMTGYAREFGPRLVDLRSAAAESTHVLARPDGEVAFVFGTERSGLANTDVERCHACCAIPADARHGSLNLAQAVQVAAYECRLALLAAVRAPAVTHRFDAEPAASVDATEGMLDHLERALLAMGYLHPDDPRRLMARLRRLLARAQPTASEVDILRGVAAAIIQRKSDRAGSKRPG